MKNTPGETDSSRFQLNENDLFRAADEGVISQTDSQKLVEWALAEAEKSRVSHPDGEPRVETQKGLNLVTVAYYFGAMLMISACAWFLGDKWNELGSHGVLMTTVSYFIIAVALGLWIRNKGFVIGGGLLITVAVCLVPLITYSIEDIAGWWPTSSPGAYEEFYPRIHSSWIVMELSTALVGAIALWFVRFGFLTAPLAFSSWFFSMDVASLVLGDNTFDWNGRAWVSVLVGVVTILIGYLLDQNLKRQIRLRSEDFAFWCYLFGLMAFWGGLTSMDSGSEFNKVIYLLINLGLAGISLWLRRTVFLIFGAMGVHIYLGHLAYRVFQDSFLFPFILALIGLSLILVTVLAQRFMRTYSGRSAST
ncbi:MAG: DUF2157 domain-containing protein [Pyrinomonadaceae bacterium]